MGCDAHCGDNLSGMMHTTEIISVVWCTPWRSSQLCAAHRRDHFRGVQHTGNICMGDHIQYIIKELLWNIKCEKFCYLCSVQHIAEIVSTLRCNLQRLSPQCDAHSRDRFRRVQHTAEIISAVWCTLRRSLCDQISWRNLNQNTLGYLSGPRWVCFMKK